MVVRGVISTTGTNGSKKSGIISPSRTLASTLDYQDAILTTVPSRPSSPGILNALRAFGFVDRYDKPESYSARNIGVRCKLPGAPITRCRIA